MKQRIVSVLITCALFLGTASVALAVQETVLLSPAGIYAAEDGTFLLTDLYNRAIWKRAADGTLTRLAGRTAVLDINGIPTGGYLDGEAAKATFQTPWGIAPYQNGWAISDPENHVIRYLSEGNVSTLAGTTKPGSADGLGKAAAFDGPMGLVATADGSLYVADTGNNSIRLIDKTGKVSTVLDKSAGLLEPAGLCYADGVLYIADSGNHRICKLDNKTLTTLSGHVGEEGDGYRDGAASEALFSQPQGVLVKDGTVYIADTGNGAVRVLKNNEVSTLLQTGEGVGGLYPVSPVGLAVVGDTLYVGDTFARLMFPLSLKSDAPSAPRFSDVPADAWFLNAVQQVSSKGLMLGVDEKQFAPSLPTDRAMCVTILYRLAGSPSVDAKIPFADVAPDAYYAKAVVWANAQGILQGEEGQFYPERNLTRAELAAFLYRMASHDKLSSTAKESASLATFTDAATVPEWAKDALLWAVETGILTGQSDQTLAPLSPVTRAEAATILMRYLDWMAKQ